MNEEPRLRTNLIRTFRLNGLSLTGDACEYLTRQLLPVGKDQRIWLEKITEYLLNNKMLSEPVVQVSHVHNAIQECCKKETNAVDDILTVINAFDMPRFRYDDDLKKFVPTKECKRRVFDVAESKAEQFAFRYALLKQRIVRHELLATFDSKCRKDDERNSGVEAGSAVALHNIDYLLSRVGKKTNVIVFGLLSQLEEGKYYLEDLTGVLPLDLSRTTFHAGIFSENCFVLAEGAYCDGVLCVQGLAMPPVETSKISRSLFENTDSFGECFDSPFKTSSRLIDVERKNDEAMIVFVADVWLDDSKVMGKLEILLSGYDDYPPVAIVLLGNFLSKPYGNRHSHTLERKFKELADLIVHYSNVIDNTFIIIVPGPADSSFANILPRPPLPTYITSEFSKRIPKSIFTTNPTRIRYCTQEIVVLREEILTKLCRNSVHLPTSEDIPLHFAKTILSQCHLVPVPSLVCPTYWSENFAFTLYPLPDVLVIADQREPFNLIHKDCIVINPGSFSSHQYVFSVYAPATKEVDDSIISAELPRKDFT